ncbi:MAG TPA: serine/threonine-protein kinase [Gammaproteobacteria bacterium]
MNGPFHVEPGMAIGNGLRIMSRLGAGGSCEVWRASTQGRADVAIKVPRADVDAAAELVRREYRVLNKLDHPGIVELLALVEPEGLPCVVTGILEGGDLVPLLGTRHACWVRAMLQVVEALGYLHERGWIHGDVKPRNVMFGATGEAKLVDFSHAARIGDALTGGGTPGYLRPDRSSKAATDDDVHALAVTLYELVFGRLPFGPDDGRGDVETEAEDKPSPKPGSAAAALDDLILGTLSGWENAPSGSVRPFADVLKSAVAELE